VVGVFVFWGFGLAGGGIGAVEKDAVELEVGGAEPGLVHHLVALLEDKGERDRVEGHRRDAHPRHQCSGPALGVEVEGSGFGGWCLGFKFWGLEFGVWCLGFTPSMAACVATARSTSPTDRTGAPTMNSQDLSGKGV